MRPPVIWTSKELQEKYKDHLSPSFWGFEIPATWYYAIDILMSNFVFDAKHNNVHVLVDQIKEKFGGLRVYYHFDTEKTTNIQACNLADEKIAYCEAIIDHTCEDCGRMGIFKTSVGWIRRSCPDCRPEVYEEK